MKKITEVLKSKSIFEIIYLSVTVLYLLVSLVVFAAAIIIRISNPEAPYLQSAFYCFFAKYHVIIAGAWLLYSIISFSWLNFLFTRRMYHVVKEQQKVVTKIENIGK